MSTITLVFVLDDEGVEPVDLLVELGWGGDAEDGAQEEDGVSLIVWPGNVVAGGVEEADLGA